MCCNANVYITWHVNRLTPWCRDLLEKLTVIHLVKKSPAFYGTRRFITIFTRSHHWSLFWARWIQTTTLHYIPLNFFFPLASTVLIGPWPSLMDFSIHRHLVGLLGWGISPTQIYSSTKDKVNVKSSLCLTKHHVMKTYGESGGIAPRILRPRH
jgi:hypothetical protein